MTNIVLDLPHAMVKSINEVCAKEGCSSQELIRIAISKMLFEQFKPIPESTMYLKETNCIADENKQDPSYEIPLDRIVAVRYTLDNGKVIHIMRGKRSNQA